MNNTFFVLRHGESIANRDKLHQGWFPRLKLTERGVEQAQGALATLKSVPVSAIYTSPILRTVQTAAIINSAFGLPLHKSRLIIEYRRSKRFEGLHYSKYINDPEYLLWKETYRVNLNFSLSDGESWSGFQARIAKFINFLQKKYHNTSIVIVSHSEVIKHIIFLLSGVDMGEGELENAGVYMLAPNVNSYTLSNL